MRWMNCKITMAIGAVAVLLAIGAGAPVHAAESVAASPAALCLSLQERAEITDLMARYAIYADAGAGDAFAAMFTDDGELIVRDAVVHGRVALAAMINRKTYRTLHLPAAPVLVKIAPDRVRARSELLYMRAGDGNGGAGDSANGAQTGFAVYEDTIVHTAQGWKFQQRKAAETQPLTPEMQPSHPMPVCALGG